MSKYAGQLQYNRILRWSVSNCVLLHLITTIIIILLNHMPSNHLMAHSHKTDVGLLNLDDNTIKVYTEVWRGELGIFKPINCHGVGT